MSNIIIIGIINIQKLNVTVITSYSTRIYAGVKVREMAQH